MRLDPFMAFARDGYPLRFVDKAGSAGFVFMMDLRRSWTANDGANKTYWKNTMQFAAGGSKYHSAAFYRSLFRNFIFSKKPLAIRMTCKEDQPASAIFRAFA